VIRELLIEVSPGELWAALAEEGVLTALRVARAGARGGVGEIVLGRVVSIKPELPAALVDIGLDRPGFLSAEDIVPRGALAQLHEGQAIVAQVTKQARADKAAGLSMRLRLDDAEPATRRQAIETAARASRAPALLEKAVSPLERLLEEFAPLALDAVIVDDRASFAAARRWLQRHHPQLAEHLSLHRGTVPLFEHRAIADDIANALSPRVALRGGGALTVELTAAATVIDVDSGSGGARARNAEAALLAVNLEAAGEVARQIRLRGLAGPIVVDFIGMRRREHRARVAGALAAELTGDGDTEVLGWTRLGHLELRRKRRHAPLTEFLFERAPGGGLVKTPLTVALEALRALARHADATGLRAPALLVHPEVAAVLEGEGREARQELETRLGRAVAVTAEPARRRDSYDIRGDRL
jgi:ribonuclease G